MGTHCAHYARRLVFGASGVEKCDQRWCLRKKITLHVIRFWLLFLHVSIILILGFVLCAADHAQCVEHLEACCHYYYVRDHLSESSYNAECHWDCHRYRRRVALFTHQGVLRKEEVMLRCYQS